MWVVCFVVVMCAVCDLCLRDFSALFEGCDLFAGAKKKWTANQKKEKRKKKKTISHLSFFLDLFLITFNPFSFIPLP